MSHKARRRPSWKKDNGTLFINLINDETNKTFCRVKVKDKQFRRNVQWMLNQFGHEFTSKWFEQKLINDANEILFMEKLDEAHN